jgi:LmbE family N-acetylglucosaminyl deacetylase
MTLLGMERGSLLVVAPHADDEVLGAGGLMALAAGRGWRVHVLYATLATYRSLARGDAPAAVTRRAEMERALAVLGATGYDVLFEGAEHHLRLDVVPQAQLIGFLEHGLETVGPAIVAVPYAAHFHQDHRAVAAACRAALRPAPAGRLPVVPTVLAYGHPAHAWSDAAAAFHPGVFIDLETVLDRKLAALECYASQLCAAPHPRSVDGVRHAAAVWGGMAGVPFAEPFECWRFLAR